MNKTFFDLLSLLQKQENTLVRLRGKLCQGKELFLDYSSLVLKNLTWAPGCNTAWKKSQVQINTHLWSPSRSPESSTDVSNMDIGMALSWS